MLCTCHSLHQIYTLGYRSGSRGSLGVSSDPALKRDFDACSCLMCWPRHFPGPGAMGRSRVPLAKDFTLRSNTRPRIFRIASKA